MTNPASRNHCSIWDYIEDVEHNLTYDIDKLRTHLMALDQRITDMKPTPKPKRTAKKESKT